MTRVARFLRPIDGQLRHGLIEDGRLWDCVGADGDLIGAMRNGGLGSLRRDPQGAGGDLAQVVLLPPVAAPEKIICVGVNYGSRNEEYRDGAPGSKYPSLFVRFPGSFVGHDQPIVRPRESDQLDYEGEIVLVVGRDGRHIGRDRAADYIAGVTLANDGTVRDWLHHARFNVTQGKNFDASGSLGPWLVSASEIDLTRPLRLTTRVNGEVRQDDNTANMIFDFSQLISYISSFTTLKVGDLILTGTPTGAGARFDPPRWLRPGDIVEIEVPEIGVLRNTVVDA